MGLCGTYIKLSPCKMYTTKTRNVQLRAVLIHTRDEQRNTKRSTHHRLLVVHTLAEPQSEVTHRLRGTFDFDALIVNEGVVLRGNACVVDHCPRVRDETRHGASEVAVNFHDLLNRGRHEER